MFCTHCGRQLEDRDRFCAACGAPLSADAVPQSQSVSRDLDWRSSRDFREILAHPEVQARIRRVAGSTPGGMSADDWLKMAQPLMSLAGAKSLKLTTLKDSAVSFYEKLGVTTERNLQRSFEASFGEILAAALCSLAARNQPITDIESAEDGCVLAARAPSSLWSWEGTLALVFEIRSDGTQLTATSIVPGRAFDWGGKNKRLETLFDDISKYLDTDL